MDIQKLISDMRAILQPQGTADVVLIRINKAWPFFEFTSSEVQEMIDELESKLLLAASGIDDEISPLTKLGIRLLLSSAYLDEKLK